MVSQDWLPYEVEGLTAGRPEVVGRQQDRPADIGDNLPHPAADPERGAARVPVVRLPAIPRVSEPVGELRGGRELWYTRSPNDPLHRCARGEPGSGEGEGVLSKPG